MEETGKIKLNGKNNIYYSDLRANGVYEWDGLTEEDSLYLSARVEERVTAVLRNACTGEKYFVRLFTGDLFAAERLKQTVLYAPALKHALWPCDLLSLSETDPLAKAVTARADRTYLGMREETKPGRTYALLFPCRDFSGFRSVQDEVTALSGAMGDGLSYEKEAVLLLSEKLLKAVFVMNRAGVVLPDLHLSRFFVMPENGEIYTDFSTLSLIEPFIEPEYFLYRQVRANEYGVEWADPFVMREALSGEMAAVDEKSQNFSVAALLFYLWFGRYPYEGAFLDGTREDFEMARVDKFQKYYATSVFIFDENDRRNELSDHFREEMLVKTRWTNAPEELRKIFTFIFREDHALRKEDVSNPGVGDWLRILSLFGMEVFSDTSDEPLYCPEKWGHAFYRTAGKHYPKTKLYTVLREFVKDEETEGLFSPVLVEKALKDGGISAEWIAAFKALLNTPGIEVFLEKREDRERVDYLHFLWNLRSLTCVTEKGFSLAAFLLDTISRVLAGAYGETFFPPSEPEMEEALTVEPHLIPLTDRVQAAGRLKKDYKAREYGFFRDYGFDGYKKAYKEGIAPGLRALYDFAGKRKMTSLTVLPELLGEKAGGFKNFIKSLSGARDEEIRKTVLENLVNAGDMDAATENFEREGGLKNGRFTKPFTGLTGTGSLPEELSKEAPLGNGQDTRITEVFYEKLPGEDRMYRILELKNGTHVMELRDESGTAFGMKDYVKGETALIGFGMTKDEYALKDSAEREADNILLQSLGEDLLRKLPAERLLYHFTESEEGRKELTLSVKAGSMDGGVYAQETAERDREFLDSLDRVFFVEVPYEEASFPYVEEDFSVSAFSTLSDAKNYARNQKISGASFKDYDGGEIKERIPEFLDDGIKGITFCLQNPERTVQIPLSSFTDQSEDGKKAMGQEALNGALLLVREIPSDYRKDSLYMKRLKTFADALQEAVLFVPVPDVGSHPFMRDDPTVFVTFKAQAVLDRKHTSVENYTRGYETEALETNECLKFVADKSVPDVGDLVAYTDLRTREKGELPRYFLCGNYYELSGLVYNTAEGEKMKYNGIFLNPDGLEYSISLDHIRLMDEMLYGKERKTVLEKLTSPAKTRHT